LDEADIDIDAMFDIYDNAFDGVEELPEVDEPIETDTPEESVEI
jgi:hypothetical protein